MVQRNSEEARFQGGQGVSILGTSIGNKGMDPNAFRKTVEREAFGPSDSSTLRILGRLAQGGEKLATQAFQQSQMEAYLSGAAQAGTLKSEDELEADPFTRAWATAGYRDTMGRVSIAENDARILADMTKMREVSPEEYNKYLAERRREMMPLLEGMSAQQRQSTFNNLLLNERAAIRRHGVEHAKFIVEAEQRSVTADVGVAFTALTKSKSDVTVYQPQLDATFAKLHGAIINNPKLPTAAKQKMLGDALEFALSQDHTPLYDRIMNEPVPMGDGTTAPMSSLMTWDEQVKLSGMYRESMNRTKALRGMEFMDRRARMEADWSNPETPLMSEAEAKAFVTEGVQAGFMDGVGQESFMEQFYKAQQKKSELGDLSAAWAAGDLTKLVSMGKTDEEGLTAWMATAGRKMDPATLTKTLISIGVQGGRPAALKQLGDVLAGPLAQLGLTDTVDPGSAAALATTISALDASEKAGRVGLFSSVMQTYPTELQAKMSYIREGLRTGLSPTAAISQATARLAEESKMSPQERVAMGEAQAKDNVKIVDELEPRGLWTTLGLKLKSLVSADAASALSITPKAGWWENPERVAEAGASAKYAVFEELRAISASNPFMSTEARKSAALGAVAARTVETEHGPFILPRGSSVQQFFGVPASTGKERVGVALSEFVKPELPGNRVIFRVNEGQLMFKELNAKGQPVRDGRLDPRQVAPMVKAQQDREAAEFRVVQGGGSTKNGITFNGLNTVGMDPKLVYNMRSYLLDGAVSISAANPAMMPAITEAFKQESDKAANYARLPITTTRKGGQNAVNLFSELAIASDFRFNQQKPYRPLLDAMSRDDMAAAVQALQQTPVYARYSEAHRVRLLDTLTKAMKGF